MKEWAEAMKARINATLAVVDAVANFEPRDAREVIEGVVDELNAFIRAEEGDDADATPVEAEPSDADGTTDEDTLPPAVELPPAEVSLRPEAPQPRFTPTRRAADELVILGAVVEIERRDSEGATADEVADATDLAIARVRELLGFMAHRGWVNRIRPSRAKHLFTTTADGRAALEARQAERRAVGQ